MGSRDSVRFGNENDPETKDVPNEGVRDTANLDETLDNDLYHDADPGAGEIQGGYGNTSLVECLGRLEAQTTSATCHSAESSRDTRSPLTDPSQASLFGVVEVDRVRVFFLSSEHRGWPVLPSPT